LIILCHYFQLWHSVIIWSVYPEANFPKQFLLFGSLRNVYYKVSSLSLSHSYWKQFQRGCSIATYLVKNNLENCPFNTYFYSLIQNSLLHKDCWGISCNFRYFWISSVSENLLPIWVDWLSYISTNLLDNKSSKWLSWWIDELPSI
jgi:hypothetical protein